MSMTTVSIPPTFTRDHGIAEVLNLGAELGLTRLQAAALGGAAFDLVDKGYTPRNVGPLVSVAMMAVRHAVREHLGVLDSFAELAPEVRA